MKIEWDGRTYELDNTKIMVRDAMVIQLYTGLSIGDWQDSLAIPRDPDAPDGEIAYLNPPPEWLKSVIGLYWLMLAQSGDRQPIGEVDFDYQEFYATWLLARVEMIRQLREEQKAAAADPTPPSPSPPPDPPSPGPSTPTATTRRRRAPAAGEGAATGS